MSDIKPPKGLAGRFLGIGDILRNGDLVGGYGQHLYWKKTVLFGSPVAPHLAGVYFRPSEGYLTDAFGFYIDGTETTVIDISNFKIAKHGKKMDIAKLKSVGIIKEDFS